MSASLFNQNLLSFNFYDITNPYFEALSIVNFTIIFYFPFIHYKLSFATGLSQVNRFKKLQKLYVFAV